MPTSKQATGSDPVPGRAPNVVPLRPGSVREPPLPAVTPQKAKERLADDSPEKVADTLGDVA